MPTPSQIPSSLSTSFPAAPRPRLRHRPCLLAGRLSAPPRPSPDAATTDRLRHRHNSSTLNSIKFRRSERQPHNSSPAGIFASRAAARERFGIDRQMFPRMIGKKKERKQTTQGRDDRKKRKEQTAQGRDGRTARRHHTGILRRGVWC